MQLHAQPIPWHNAMVTTQLLPRVGRDLTKDQEGSVCRRPGFATLSTTDETVVGKLAVITEAGWELTKNGGLFLLNYCKLAEDDRRTLRRCCL